MIDSQKIRAERSAGVFVNRSILQDSRLSLKAKALLIWLLDKPYDWNCTIKGIASQCADRECSIKSAIKELKEYGYLEIEQIRDEYGKITGSIWHVFRIEIKPKPDIEEIITTSRFPTRGKSTRGKSPIRNNQEEILNEERGPHKKEPGENGKSPDSDEPNQEPSSLGRRNFYKLRKEAVLETIIPVLNRYDIPIKMYASHIEFMGNFYSIKRCSPKYKSYGKLYHDVNLLLKSKGDRLRAPKNWDVIKNDPL